MQTSKKWKKAVYFVGFLFIVCVVNEGLNYMLCPYTYARADVHRLETGEYQDIIVGSSHGKCGIDPDTLAKITGRQTVNFCMGGQYPVDSYMIVKEACRVAEPERVIYELDPGYWIGDIPQDTSYAQTYGELPLSVVKAEYFFGKICKGDFRNTIFPWYVFRSQLGQIKENVKMKQSEAYREYAAEPFCDDVQSYTQNGFIYRNRIDGDKAEPDVVVWDEDQMQEENQMYFRKMKALCEENQIELIVVTTPVPQEMYAKYEEQYKAAALFFERFFEEEQVRYLNYNDGTNSWPLSEYADWEGHFYGDTAAEFSRVLAGDIGKAAYAAE